MTGCDDDLRGVRLSAPGPRFALPSTRGAGFFNNGKWDGREGLGGLSCFGWKSAATAR
jgi:hypothetical protein